MKALCRRWLEKKLGIFLRDLEENELKYFSLLKKHFLSLRFSTDSVKEIETALKCIHQ